MKQLDTPTRGKEVLRVHFGQGTWVACISSAPLSVCHNRRIGRHRVLVEAATRGKSGRLLVAPSKGHDEQVVYITPFAVASLRDLRMMQEVLDDGAPEFGLMRPARTTGPDIKPFENKARIFRLSAAQSASGRPATRPDSAAPTAATRAASAWRMVRAGAPLPGVQRQGRWKSPAMPARYTRNEDAGQAARWLV
ncbi:MAG: hypothetical protein OXO48_19540 [Caldilineaceae bacterium]|nr:hypothetical protein [Caldilineaceae bacterium]